MTQYAKPKEEMTKSTQVFQDICEEVWELASIDFTSLHSMLRVDGEHTPSPLNDKLQSILDDYTSYPSDILCAWLRYSSRWKKDMPAWQLLVDASYVQAIARNSQEFADQLFVGFVPGTPMYEYNMREDGNA